MFVKRARSRILLAAMCALLLVALLGADVPGVIGQGGDMLAVEFTPYEDNPVLTPGEEGEWDSGMVAWSTVVHEDGRFHMLYAGGLGDPNPTAIGYATSEDGLNWTKYEGNPVLALDDARIGGATWPVFVSEGDTWVLYVHLSRTFDAGPAWRATAPEPAGPWTVDDEPVLEPGGYGAWDRQFSLDSILHTEDGYALYYSSVEWLSAGLATSPDGIAWTKYDDPDTTDRRFRESDPILRPLFGGGGWDQGFVGHPVVRVGEFGWGMFYTGGQVSTEECTIGYATSEDGITWTRYGEEPILPLEEGMWYQASSVVVVDETYYLYYTILESTATGPWINRGIGLATGTITRGEAEE